MPSVLVIGPFRDHSGWSRGASDTALALDAAGLDVAIRTVKFTGRPTSLSGRLAELEAKPASGRDVVIQYTIPSTYDFDGRFATNIGSFFVETSHFRDSGWAKHINTMDRAWVHSRHNREAAIQSGVTVPIGVVPCPTDVTRYERHHQPLRLRDELGYSFIFYFIGEYTRRKNILTLAKAFHLEFAPTEPVELLIQSQVPGLDPKASLERIRGELAVLKENLNLYPDERWYKPELILTDRIAEADVLRLHATGDCFASAACGEGWGIPCFDAMAMGRTPIHPSYSAPLDYLSDREGWLVEGRMEPVTGMRGTHGGLYTARQEWMSVDVAALRRAMREAYERPDLRAAKAKAGMRRAYDFDLAAVGRQMREGLSR